MAEDCSVALEEGTSWIPPHVLDEACSDIHLKEHEDQRHQRQGNGLKSPVADSLLQSQSKFISKPHQRPRNLTNWAAGGPGMQVIFLDSGQRSCGTGVFLPRRAGEKFQSTTKSACSPVLLPTRVVQALNLNVHELGLQIKPRDNNSPSMLSNNKDNDAASSQSCVISQNLSSSPDIFLPKEWTY